MQEVFERMEANGQSQRWLAKQLGIHYTLLSKYNTGLRTAPPDVVRRARALVGLPESPDVDILSPSASRLEAIPA